MTQAVSVFLFTGFLGGGKTTFIQRCLENIQFCNGEPTLLLVCEQGEAEYDSSCFANTCVTLRYIEDESGLSAEALEKYRKGACDATRVLVEYNGMWMKKELMAAMPDQWKIFREMTFMDATTFLIYNNNMRQLVVDKLRDSLVVVLVNADGQLDRERIHTVVRAASRRIDIVYQHGDGSIEKDDIPEKDPVDLSSNEIIVDDDDFAWWARDISEEPEKYVGKKLKVHAMAINRNDMNFGEICFGRYVMVCCEEDIQFMGFVCEGVDRPVSNGWIDLTGRIRIGYHQAYKSAGPIFTCLDIAPAAKPQREVAAFYY